ncbi:metallophosphoesterase family protein [Caulobacter sp. KR2-114]|uniref:metallophosphoesterase family protein n=1 Tax=Caulobacter sp. KR2-114 TaxID=3400912 RepID=UPI003C02DDEA
MPQRTVIAVLADCHIHPAAGISWPQGALEKLADADRIITLGDMGEASAIAELGAIAPVAGVRGQDDEPSDAVATLTLTLEEQGLIIGCVFDPVAAGLADSRDPFVPSADDAEAEEDLFDGPLDVLLCASTHRAEITDFAGRLTIDPGTSPCPRARTTAPEAHSPG